MQPRARSDGGTRSAVDPLTYFLDQHRQALPPTRGKRFNAGEHAWLASHGAEKACSALKNDFGIEVDPMIFERIARRTGREELQYGELVALSGDFYESPQALFDEEPAKFAWLWEDNDLSDLRGIFAEELRWIEARRARHPADTYPDANIRLAWNAKSYVELALRNTDHFGWHNMCRYVQYHDEALQLAVAARGQHNEQFRRALYTNAFADHFLTDGFAAGHVRVPRAEIRDWANASGYGEKIAGALSKLLHDQDGHVDTHSLHGSVDENHRDVEDGLYVRDATGTAWYTYCDGQLFLDPKAADSMAVMRPVDAVALSLRELLLAWQRRETPFGVFAATRLVPFPHPDAPTLASKFPGNLADEELDRLWNSVAWYTKVPWLSGLKREHVVALFAALPRLMEAFRASVAATSREPVNKLRMHPAYIDAFRNVA